MIASKSVLSDLIYDNLQLLNVLGTYNIKPGIGEKTIRDICSEYHINERFFISILRTYCDADYFPKAKEIDVNMLIDYLNKNHKFYLRITIPRIEQLLLELKRKLKNERALKLIVKFFREYKTELLKHFRFEEEVLFPMIKKERIDKYFSNKYFNQLKEEHTNVEDKLLDLKRILVKFLPKRADEQLVFDLLYVVAGFEKNHFDHSRFEDKILIPKLKSFVVKKSERK